MKFIFIGIALSLFFLLWFLFRKRYNDEYQFLGLMKLAVVQSWCQLNGNAFYPHKNFSSYTWSALRKFVRFVIFIFLADFSIYLSMVQVIMVYISIKTFKLKSEEYESADESTKKFLEPIYHTAALLPIYEIILFVFTFIYGIIK